MTALKLPQRMNVNLANNAVVGYATLHSQHVTLPAVPEWPSDTAVPVLSVVALNNICMHVQRSGFHQSIERLCVLIPFWNKQCIDLAAQIGAIADVGEFTAYQQCETKVAVLKDGR